ncbi:Lipid A export ATP-binding/permease protein MsbA [compost metagenome]
MNIVRELIYITRYIFVSAYKHGGKLLVYYTLFSITTSLLPFVFIIMPKLLIEELMTTCRASHLLLIIGLSSLIYTFIIMLKNYFNAKSVPYFVSFRYELTMKHWEKTMQKEFESLEDSENLDLNNRALRAVASTGQGFEAVLKKYFELLSNILSILGYGLILSKLNFFVIILIFLILSLNFFVDFRAKQYDQKLNVALSSTQRKEKYMKNIMNDFTYAKDIRLYDMAKWIRCEYETICNKIVSVQSQIMRRYLVSNIFTIVTNSIQLAIINGYLIYRVIVKSIMIADLVMFFSTINRLIESLGRCIQIVTEILKEFMIIKDYKLYMDTNPIEENKLSLDTKIISNIQFENVFYKYPNSNQYILENISTIIEKGKRIAIVGPNGSGKTTFIKLLLKLYGVTDGAIYLDGKNIQEFIPDTYFALFSVVFQDVKVLAFSIWENVSLQELNIEDKAKVIDSIFKAGLENKIKSLPNRVYTNLLKIFDENGIDLSGGEKQKLAISRALYKDAPIVILDEPTAALDPLAEHEIYSNFNTVANNKTAIYVSHRLSSTRFCDSIIVFDKGTIVECGTHSDLLERNGLYANMFRMQAQYFI